MITEKEFEKLTLKEQVKYFEELGIDFIVNTSAEKITFVEKEESNDMLICFYDNCRSEWCILTKLRMAYNNLIEAQYIVVSANGSYNEEANLLPIRKLKAEDLFKEYEK